MEVKLDPQMMCLTEDNKLDLRKALQVVGVKAAVCYKDGDITPEMIRENESAEQLIKRGLNTIKNEHTSPSEQINVLLEITGIPKILCMVLNNEHEYAADERSLRYTPIINGTVSDLEIALYDKWVTLFTNILNKEYYDFFVKFNQGKDEESTKRKTVSAISKIAQENARYMTSVFIPTTLTYSVPLAQINKICLSMQRVIDKPLNEFEELLIPYFEDFIKQLKELNVIITNKKVKELGIIDVNDNDDYFYQNSKNIDLSLFAEHNQFSGIDLPNCYDSSFSYNMDISLACLAQFHRHRTMDFEMKTPSKEDKSFYTPLLLEGKDDLIEDWHYDMLSVMPFYPQGKIAHTNVNGSLKNLVHFVGKERACDKAFTETQDMFTNQMLPDIYMGLIASGNEQLAFALEPYVNRLRCMYPDYKCPAPCGHPRVRRLF